MTHLVMFDIDGTLVDSAGFDGDRYAEAVRDVPRFDDFRDREAVLACLDAAL